MITLNTLNNTSMVYDQHRQIFLNFGKRFAILSSIKEASLGISTILLASCVFSHWIENLQLKKYLGSNM